MSAAATATTTVTLTLDREQWVEVRDVLAAALRLRVEGQATTLREAPVGVGPGSSGPTVMRLLDALAAIVDAGALGPLDAHPPP